MTVLKSSNIKKIFCRKKQICAEDHRIIPSDYYSEINIGVKCMCVYLHLVYIHTHIPLFCPLRARTSNETSTGMRILHAQILVSKYHSLSDGTGLSLEKWQLPELGQARNKMSPEHAILYKVKEVSKEG